MATHLLRREVDELRECLEPPQRPECCGRVQQGDPRAADRQIVAFAKGGEQRCVERGLQM